jgi:hypothetical protein
VRRLLRVPLEPRRQHLQHLQQRHQQHLQVSALELLAADLALSHRYTRPGQLHNDSVGFAVLLESCHSLRRLSVLQQWDASSVCAGHIGDAAWLPCSALLVFSFINWASLTWVAMPA